MRVAVAFDHRGVKLRDRILATIHGLGHETVDLGTDRSEPRIDSVTRPVITPFARKPGSIERRL